MEKITINEINEKPSGLVIIKYNTEAEFKGQVVKECTMNTKWQSQEVNFLKADVGIGGSCEALIVQKGEYINLTKINMDANFTKGNAQPVQERPADTTQEVKGTPNPQRVGLYIKLAVEMLIAAPVEGNTIEQCLCENIQEIQKAERFTIGLLSQ